MNFESNLISRRQINFRSNNSKNSLFETGFDTNSVKSGHPKDPSPSPENLKRSNAPTSIRSPVRFIIES